MPKVPSNVIPMTKSATPAPPPVDETYLAMAIASMHAEGKLQPKAK